MGKLMLMPDTCTEDTASDMDEDTDTVTTLERDPLMPNPKLMLDTSMEVMVLDMAAAGVRHSEVQLPIAFYKELSSRNCQIAIKSKNFLKTSQPLIKVSVPPFCEE